MRGQHLMWLLAPRPHLAGMGTELAITSADASGKPSAATGSRAAGAGDHAAISAANCCQMASMSLAGRWRMVNGDGPSSGGAISSSSGLPPETLSVTFRARCSPAPLPRLARRRAPSRYLTMKTRPASALTLSLQGTLPQLPQSPRLSTVSLARC